MASFDTADSFTDVVELCALLQCIGFNVKSLNTSEGNLSQDGGSRTVAINCQSSGLHVVLESGSAACSCPVPNQHNGSFWQVDAVSGGKQHDKKYGSALLGCLPAAFRDRMAKDLRDMVKGIKEHNDLAGERTDTSIRSTTDKVNLSNGAINRSASMVELKSTPPETKLLQIKADTPTRYRSLDTLTAAKDGGDALPPPGSLIKHAPSGDTSADDLRLENRLMCRRQSTYTVASNSESIRRRNKTSSPIQTPQNTILENLLIVEKAAADLREKIAAIISECTDERNLDESSMSALDVSKISLLKGSEPRSQFASSPNLSALRSVREEAPPKGVARRFTRASTSNLSGADKPALKDKDSKVTKLRRLSPNFFKLKKDSPGVKADKSVKDSKTPKLSNSGIKPRIVTPVRIPRANIDGSPSLSASKKKYGHIKSTIPRLSSVKKE